MIDCFMQIHAAIILTKRLLAQLRVFSPLQIYGRESCCRRRMICFNLIMSTSILHLLPVLCLFLSVAATIGNTPPYVPTDVILLSCGQTSNTTSRDGRNWDGDVQSKFTPSNSATNSVVSKASRQAQSVPEVPYLTARIFRSKFTYTFPLLPGPKFLRLYFYPVSYSQGFDITTSFFSVSANTYTLLNNFSAYLTVSAMDPPVATFIKEFVIAVSEDPLLNISFTPSPSSFAFINGIEVVSMPDNLYIGQSDKPITFVNNENPFYFDKSTALETVYRINVGGKYVSGADDTGMFREWSNDLVYIHGKASGTAPYLPEATIKYTTETPAYVAPVSVYRTSRTMGRDPSVNKNYNLTWTFPVDTGFNYLVRLHFCETQLEVKHVNQRVFSIFIDNQTAVRDADVINWSGGSGIPVYRDFVTLVPINNPREQDFWLALHPFLAPNLPAKYADAILNGLEIFKLSNSDGNLAGPNPEPRVIAPKTPELQPRQSERTKNKGWLLVVIIIAAVLGSVSALSLLCFVVLRKKRKVLNDSATSVKETKSSWGPISCTVTSTATNNSSLPSDICRRFSIAEIKEATSYFDDQYIVGTGGFGHVYKGYLDDGSTAVAIKRLNSSSNQGTREFHTEIEMISKVRHLHIVSLIGYCDDYNERILVYEYMSRGNLRDHLYKTRNPPLPWKRRLEICIAVARGLHYLHAGAKHVIIHRDIKSTNILLDENWVAKISDFGLSKLGPTGISQTHISTVVKGSFGYVDPEYFRRQQLTEKSDVYSFGVVLLEVLCARPSVMNGVPKEEASLPVWARLCQARGTIDQIIDPTLRGEIAPVCLTKFVETAETCVRDEGIQRPTMGDVVWALEFALQLQETSEKNIGPGRSQIGLEESNSSAPRGEVTATDDDENFSGSVRSQIELKGSNSSTPRGGVTATDDDEIFSGSGGHVSDSRSTISSGGKSITKYDDGMKSDTVFSELMRPKGR